MQEMSNLDYYFALEEIGEVRGARLSNVYQYPGYFRFKFNKHGAEYNLLIAPGERAHLTKYLEEPPKQPPRFSALLRKLLGNAVLEDVEQINLDRLFSVGLRKRARYRLVFEMFGKGNVVLCDEDGKIMHVLEKAEYAARKLAPGEKYSPPPGEKRDFRALKPEDVAGLRGKIISVLSKTINLSPFYLEEACARAGIKKDASELSEEQALGLVHSLAGLAKEKKPVLYLKEGKPTVFSPFPLKKLEGQGFEEKAFSSFNEALDEYYRAQPKQLEETERLRRLRRALKQQETALKEFEEKERTAREKAEAIYAHYDVVEEALEAFRKMKAGEKGGQFEEVFKKFRAKATKTGFAINI